jgi:hypothetical protein
MQNGWVSLTAQNKDNLKNLHGVWRGGFRLTTFATVATCILAVIFCFAAPLDKFLPGVPPRLVQAAILFALPGILAMNIVTICSSVMNGLSSQSGLSNDQVGSALSALAPVLLSSLSAASNQAPVQRQRPAIDLSDGIDASDIMGFMQMMSSAQGGAQRRPQNQASFDGSDLLGLLSMLK